MTADFSAQRANMVEGQLRTTDVTDVPLLHAMADIPREDFVPGRWRSLAYLGEDLEITTATTNAPARYLMDPSPFAKLIQLAEVDRSDFVLDVGCATGYSSAVLSRLASSVIALECAPDLVEMANSNLAKGGYDNVTVIEGELSAGYPSEAPYDVIFIGGAVEDVPAALLDQLKEGGRLVTVRGYGNAGFAELYVKEDGIVSSRRTFNAAVKPLPGFQRVPAFVF